MSALVHIFACTRCNRGGFRSLPDPDGKAYCPWCGDRVAASTETPPAPAPDGAAASIEFHAEIDRIARDAPDIARRALQDRLAEVERRCDQAESELRRELDKKQGIKKAVLAEMGQMESQLSAAKASLQQKEEEFLAVLLETKALREELAQERKRAEDQLAARGKLEDKINAVHSLGEELEASRKSLKEAREARDGAGRDAEQARSELVKVKNNFTVELAELRKKLAAAEARVQALKGSGDELKALKKEQIALGERSKALQTDLEKRDQRIKELQLLIKTLGERLNDLSSRRL